MPLLLSASEVQPLLDMPRAIAATERAFLEQGHGAAVLHGQYALPMERHPVRDRSGAFTGRRLRVTSGGLLESGKLGIQCTGTGVGSPVALLYDCEGGLIAIMGYPFGQLRTGATVALAAKYLARPDARRVGLIGTGRNALSQLQGAVCVRAVQSISAFSRDAERRTAFCRRATESLGMPVTPVASAREAVAGMDLVLVATNSWEPVFQAADVAPGAFVGSMGRITELDPELLLRADGVVVSSMEQERTRYYNPDQPIPLDDLIAQGKLPATSVLELGELITGDRPGRRSSDEVWVFHESQGGFGSVALAAAAYEEACRLGLGREVEL